VLQINVPAAFLSIYSSRRRVVSATVEVWDPNLGARNLCIVLAGVCRLADITPRLTFCETYGNFTVRTDLSDDAAFATEGLLMAELSEGEKQSLDDALSTLDDLYEVTLKPDGGFTSEQMEAIAKLAEEAMGCVLSVLDPEMCDAVQRDCPEKKLGREARAVRILTLFDETPQKKLAGVDTADLLRRRLSLDETVAVPLLLATNRGAAA
jgi:hypothetical protein